MSCRHDCARPPVFPQRIDNRPGLDTIAYRIGVYAQIREYLLDRIGKRPELSGWTHREADDPGIALLESGAVVADILTFYQKLYGNEAFLRPAKWQESVFALVRLLGYRPAPGVGGTATFAVTVKGDEPVTIPQGFGFKVKLEGADEQAEFESSEEVVAYAHLGEFRLFCPRLSEQNITPATAGNQLELKAVDGSELLDDLTAVAINPGDRIMLVPNARMFNVTGTAYSAQKRAEILVVSKVETVLDRVVITFEGALTETRGPRVSAYILGRSFRHFGHDAPPLTTMLSDDPSTAAHVATRFTRTICSHDYPSASETNYYSAIARNDMPLDKEVNDLAAGGSLVCEGRMTFRGQSTAVPFTVVRTITEVRSDSLFWGNKSGATTVVTLNRRLIANTGILDEVADIRKLRVHETVSPRLTLRAPTQWESGAFPDSRLNFFGTLEEAEALRGRQVMLAGADGNSQEVNVQSDLPALDGATGDEGQRMWEIELDRTPEFTREDFDEVAPQVTGYGNLVPATQGKTEKETVLGSGDNRREFQTFSLPKSPLTYLLDATTIPPEVPELDVYVDNVLWERVDTLYGASPDDKVYIVREDDEGASWVQFGNGVMGARLPSGRNNVVAVYRTGVGASGSPEKDPQASGRLTGLDKVILPAPVVGGAAAETQTVAREAAPGWMQSLGRLVGLSDYEAEALTIPGVLKVRAYWAALEGLPLIQLVVLTESGTNADLEYVRETMATYNRAKGPSRHSIAVVAGVRQYVHVALTAGYDPALRSADVTAAVKMALGMTGEEGDGIEAEDGLFGLDRRTFGQSAHVSQIVGRAQQAEGVRWVLADAAQLIALGAPPETDPLKLAIPATRAMDQTLACDAACILALHTNHLELNLVADEQKEVSN